MDQLKEIIATLTLKEDEKEVLLKEVKAVQKNVIALEFKFKRTVSDKTAITNILNASIHAMHFALDQLTIRPERLLIDGNQFHPYQFIPHQCIIKGDEKILSIACASILAKNYRDQLMIELHQDFPDYGWNKNMGYATKVHREALNKYGSNIHHRQSFRLKYD